jgi:anti-sigma B factor antagonist
VAMDFSLHVQGRVGGGVAVTVRGDLDHGTAQRFLDCIDHCLRPAPATLYVDLHLTTFVDSSGLGALVIARKRAERVGTGLILEQPTQAVRRTLQVTGIATYFSVSPS